MSSISMNGTAGLKLSLTNRVLPTDSVYISYISSSGNLTYLSGAPTTTVESFTDDYVDNFSKATTEIKTISDKNQIQVLPNPVNNELHLKNVNANSRIVISNMLGQNIKVIGNFFGSTINVSELKSGIYLISVKNPDGTYVYSKFLKK